MPKTPKRKRGDADDAAQKPKRARAPKTPPEGVRSVVNPKRPYIIGIDVGTRNIGVCVMNARTAACRLFLIDLLIARDESREGQWRNINLEGRVMHDVVSNYMATLDKYIRRAHMIVIERQMRSKFITLSHIMQTMIRERYDFDRCYLVDARSTRMRLQKRYAFTTRLSNNGKNYAKSKTAGKEACRVLMPPAVFKACCKKFTRIDSKTKKKEVRVDALDAFLMCVSALYFEEEIVKGASAPLKFNKKPVTDCDPVKSVKVKIEI